MTRATPSRRALLVGSAALAAGAGAGAVGMRLSDGDAGANPVAARPDDAGPTTVPFYGEHQAGITTAQQTHVSLVGLDLVRGVDARGVKASCACSPTTRPGCAPAGPRSARWRRCRRSGCAGSP